jgi:hypothetical protein
MARPVEDPNRPPARLVIREFPGSQSNVDPHDLSPGVSQTQRNVMALRQGELRIRPGCQTVWFEF